MRKSSLGLLAGLAIATGVHAAPTVNYTASSGVSSDENSSSSATSVAGVHTLTNAGTGEDWVWVKLTLDTTNPIQLSWLKSITFDIMATNGKGPYIASPVFVIDADNNGSIDFSDPFLALEGAQSFGADRAIFSDFTVPDSQWDVKPPADPEYSDLSTKNREALGGSMYWSPHFAGYKTFADTLSTSLPAAGVDATDRVDAIYLVIGGSTGFGSGSDADPQVNTLSNIVVTIPEPASLGLLGIGALMLFRRRRAG